MTRPQARWDMGPVLTLWRGRSIVELARHTGIAHRQFVRWLHAGVPDRSADRLGMALGCGPEAIWPEWYAGAGSPEIVDHIAAGTIRAAFLRRVASLASGSAKPPKDSEPDLEQEPPIPPPSEPLAPLVGLIPRSRGRSDDLVYIFPNWLTDSANPPGLPPRKEEASCACRNLDRLRRPPIGWCGPTCERRPA